MKTKVTIALATASFLLFPRAIEARIIGWSGPGLKLEPPPSLVSDDTPWDNDHQLAFDENQGVLLTREIAVDPYDTNPRTQNVLLPGTIVDSHLIFF